MKNLRVLVTFSFFLQIDWRNSEFYIKKYYNNGKVTQELDFHLWHAYKKHPNIFEQKNAHCVCDREVQKEVCTCRSSCFHFVFYGHLSSKNSFDIAIT